MYMNILFAEERLMPLRTWINSRIKKVHPLTLHSIWIRCQNPETVFISEYAEIEENVIFCQGVEIRGQSKIGKNTTLDKNAVIADSIIGAHNRIHPSTIVAQSIVGDNGELGPHASIELSRIGERSHIGFTAQVKRSTLGKRTMAVHHCYIGDTESGEGVNFGAGSVTCNYDGGRKHPTRVGNSAFIGTNANLIAPIVIGDECFIAAGTTVSGKLSIPSHSFVIGRAHAKLDENRYSFSSEKGYEVVRLGKDRMQRLIAFLGEEEFSSWLEERNSRFGNVSPLEVFRKNPDDFDRAVDGILNSCCT